MKEFQIDEMSAVKDDEIEIDLLELLRAYRKKWKQILLAMLLCGGLAFAGTRYVMTPVYTSTSSILILTKETTLASLSDLQMGSQLTNDYEVLITSRPVLEAVVKNLNLNMEYTDLRQMITISNPGDSRIIEVSVDYSTPDGAKEIVNELVNVSITFIGDMMGGIPPKIIETGEIPNAATGPSTTKNTLLGIFAGFAISIGIITVIMLMDDTIKTEEDVEHYLGLPTLASIPDRKDYVNKKKSDSKKKQQEKPKKAKKMKKQEEK